jgi:lipoyl synthase
MSLLQSPHVPKPDWLKVKLPHGPAYQALKATRQSRGLATVCEEARCPNLAECWAGGTATFMLLGDTCTRGCRFCAVKTGNPQGHTDPDEPAKLAQSIQEAGWQYVVLTMVNRDDLPDGGAAHVARCITHIRQAVPTIRVEVLVSDFAGQRHAMASVLAAQPDIVAHNVETIERLTPTVRDRRAGYAPDVLTKTSLMLGLGETDAEVHQAMADCRQAGVDVLMLGQYLQPSAQHLPVHHYVTPEQFRQWQQVAESTHGFLYCAAGPLVRSSYRAGELFLHHLLDTRRETHVSTT